MISYSVLQEKPCNSVEIRNVRESENNKYFQKRRFRDLSVRSNDTSLLCIDKQGR